MPTSDHFQVRPISATSKRTAPAGVEAPNRLPNGVATIYVGAEVDEYVLQWRSKLNCNSEQMKVNLARTAISLVIKNIEHRTYYHCFSGIT